MAQTPPGTEITLTISRAGNVSDVTAKLDEANPETAKNIPGQPDENAPGKQNESGKLGLTLQPVTPGVARQLGLPADAEGLVVTGVDPAGAAADSGIARGDLISEINGQTVNSVEDVRSALDDADSKPVLLLVTRRGNTFYVTIRFS